MEISLKPLSRFRGPPLLEPEPEPEPLAVAIVGVPDVAVAGESYELTAQSDEESLVYEWSVAGGTIEGVGARIRSEVARGQTRLDG